MAKYIAVGVAATLALAGCTNLPVGGPQRWDIELNAAESLTVSRRTVVTDYVLVDVTNEVLDAIPEIGPGSFFHSFGAYRGTPSFRVGVGDTLQITIFESSSGGLFAGGDPGLRPGNFVTLPTQTVGTAGTISVPFAGEVQAARRTTQEIKEDIERKLAGRAVEPQVVVAWSEQAASVTVIGDVSNRLPLRPGERVIDIVARAGGIRNAGYELFVTLIRGGRSATVYFPTLIRNSSENVLVAPGDLLYINREQQKFVAVGALGVGGQTQGVTGLFAFEQERLSLSEAIAKAGGLVGTRANAQIFVYRTEMRDALDRMGVDTKRFSGQQVIPTIYRVNYRDPSVFFFTQRFPMRHRDAIYVANSDSVELEKFLAHTTAITSTISGSMTDIVVTRSAGAALSRAP